MDRYECPEAIQPQQSVRTLQIEEEGDPWKAPIKPKIRLLGRWLERAGFKPGNRVQVTCIAPGLIELRSFDSGLKVDQTPSSKQTRGSS